MKNKQRIADRDCFAPSGFAMTLLNAIRYPLSAKKGFTLIEVLVAISVFAIIAGAIFAVFSRGLSIWEDARIKTNFREEPLIFLDGLEKGLKNHITLYDSRFQLEPQRILFTTIGTEIYNIQYIFDKGKKGLYKYKAAYPAPATLAEPLLILNNVKDLKFAGEAPEAGKFPKAIKVDLTVTGGKRQDEYNLQRIISMPVIQ